MFLYVLSPASVVLKFIRKHRFFLILVVKNTELTDLMMGKI